MACDSRTVDAEFMLAKREYISLTGRVRGADDVIAYHLRQSFMPGEITPEEANRIGCELAKRFTKGNNAFVVCNHIDKAQAVTERYNLLAGQIKSAEKRMAEIAVLRTQIINYSMTRDVYTAYRKAGYSKKFLAEHEADILLHKVAKKAFDELGVQKLPRVKELQSEYAVLLAEKKKAYAEYQQVRQEMQEVLTAKANVDRLLGTEEQNKEKERKRNYCKR